jgi:tetratricopeptide (TPR) repeat protein
VYQNSSGTPDPLFKLLRIEILRGRKEEVYNLAAELERRFPKAVDEQVQTELANHYIDIAYFTPVRDILLAVLDKKNKTYPYPPAYYAYAQYYRAISNAQLQEDFLRATISAESERTLPHPWNFRDKVLATWATDRSYLDGFVINQRDRDRVLLFPWDRKNSVLLSNAYNDLGEIHARNETFDKAAEAIGFFKKSIDENPSNAKAHFNLAQLYFYRVKDYGNASKYYTLFDEIARKSNNVESDLFKDLNYNLGFIHYEIRQFDKALSYWSQLSETIPDNPYVNRAVGSAFLHVGAYNAALGEFLMLSEVYDGLIDRLGEIKPWRDYHRRIILEAAAVYNNLAVAYYMLGTGAVDRQIAVEYEKNALLALYKAGELVDILGVERGNIQYNIQKIIHPKVVRGDMAIHDTLSDTYRFSIQ